jgi:hypothetical protein
VASAVVRSSWIVKVIPLVVLVEFHRCFVQSETITGIT